MRRYCNNIRDPRRTRFARPGDDTVALAGIVMTLLFVFTSLASCYDGWEPRNNGGTGTTIPTPGPSVASLFFVQFMPIYLTDDAVASTACFGATGTETYRKTEWKERIARISEAVAPLAERFVTTPISISATDCATFAAVETAAIGSSIIENLTDDSQDRPIVQLKAVFWDGDANGTFSTAVTREDWSSVRTVKSRGRKVVSLTYFSRSNKTTGRFSSWYDLRTAGFTSSRVLSGTAIDTVDPTSAGAEHRAAIASSDASAVASWVLWEASKI